MSTRSAKTTHPEIPGASNDKPNKRPSGTNLPIFQRNKSGTKSSNTSLSSAPRDRSGVRPSTTNLATIPVGNPGPRRGRVPVPNGFNGFNGGQLIDEPRMLVRMAASCAQPLGEVHNHFHIHQQDNTPTKEWENCQVGEKINQVNGHRMYIHSGNQMEVPMGPIGGHHIFRGCTKKGKGIQINGNEVVDVDGQCRPTFPDSSTQYFECTFEAMPSNDSKIQGAQVNGGVYKGKGDIDYQAFEK